MTDNSLMQSLPIEPPDYDKLREAIENMTDEERLESVYRYMRARYMTTTRWQG